MLMILQGVGQKMQKTQQDYLIFYTVENRLSHVGLVIYSDNQKKLQEKSAQFSLNWLVKNDFVTRVTQSHRGEAASGTLYPTR